MLIEIRCALIFTCRVGAGDDFRQKNFQQVLRAKLAGPHTETVEKPSAMPLLNLGECKLRKFCV